MKRAGFFMLVLFPAILLGRGNPWKAGLSSLILPGSGEHYLGLKTRTYGFLAAEISLWLTYAGFTYHARRLDEDYRIYAYSKCGADPDRVDSDYWQAIELNMNRDAYMEKLWREARSYYPDNPDSQEAYVRQHAVAGDWNWPSKAEWFHFQDMRKASRITRQRAEVTFGFIIVNHIASAVDAFISSRLLGDSGASSFDLDIRINPSGRSTVALYRKF